MSSCWLNGKTCVVTGASGGIGAGITATLIKKHNCKVIGIARNEAKIKKFKDELGLPYANKFSYRLFDVSKKESWQEFATELAEKGIRIDVLINNAGILPKFKSFDKYSTEEIENVMNINFYSAVYSSRALLPQLLKSKSPAIINIDSSASLMSLAGTCVYSASKSALKSFTEAMREELRGRVYVGIVCPGFTKTDIFRNQSGESPKGQRLVDMISADCNRMVKMIMFGIEHKKSLQIHGIDAHAMNIAGKLLPVNGTRLFSYIMKASDIDIFSEIFKNN